jgi:hypothetical protein
MFVHELAEDMTLSAQLTRLFGDAIWDQFVEFTLDECMYRSMPVSWDALQHYKMAVENVVSLEETMVNTGNFMKNYVSDKEMVIKGLYGLKDLSRMTKEN